MRPPTSSITPRASTSPARVQRECGQWELAADDLRRARDIATRGRMRLHLIPRMWRGAAGPRGQPAPARRRPRGTRRRRGADHRHRPRRFPPRLAARPRRAGPRPTRARRRRAAAARRHHHHHQRRFLGPPANARPPRRLVPRRRPAERHHPRRRPPGAGRPTSRVRPVRGRPVRDQPPEGHAPVGRPRRRGGPPGLPRRGRQALGAVMAGGAQKSPRCVCSCLRASARMEQRPSQFTLGCPVPCDTINAGRRRAKCGRRRSASPPAMPGGRRGEPSAAASVTEGRSH